MEVSITLSANAGVCICVGNDAIWVDALHNKKVPGFSSVTPELFSEIMNPDRFTAPKAFCFTHGHPDHYSKEMTEIALSRYPDSELILPWESNANCWCIGDIKLTRSRLPHDGDRYAELPHYGFLISVHGKNILIPGDCRLCDPELLRFVDGRNIDLALLNFPWYTLKKARTFVADQLKPRFAILYHLPFVKDDCNGYAEIAANAAKYEGNTFLLTNPLQQIILDI